MSRNEEYEEYMKKYAKSRGINEEEAYQHVITKEYWKWLGERDKNAVVDRTSDT